MKATLRQKVLQLPLRGPFVIVPASHGTGRTSTAVIVELASDGRPGIAGYGEGYPDRSFAEVPETMAAVLPMLLGQVDHLVGAVDSIE